MEKITLDIPALWADHHVLAVREALVSLDGVDDVVASAAWRQVMVTFDKAKTNQAAIESALAGAGYAVGQGGPPILAQTNDLCRDSQWGVLGARTTKTNQSDLTLSGEFRRY